MTNGLRVLLIVIVIAFLGGLHALGGAGLLLALPLYYALYRLFTMKTTEKS